MCLCAEEIDDVYRLSAAQFTRVNDTKKHVCGDAVLQPYTLCVQCHDSYVSQGRRTHSDVQRRHCDAFESSKKNVAFARLLALAPDLLSRSEPLHERGIYCSRLLFQS